MVSNMTSKNTNKDNIFFLAEYQQTLLSNKDRHGYLDVKVWLSSDVRRVIPIGLRRHFLRASAFVWAILSAVQTKKSRRAYSALLFENTNNSELRIVKDHNKPG
uniref:Uncharacterized protein n=1 Tax=Cacopsylla melanoneura TaxID=428564 RepID=A0A8D8WYT0_9HEMI